MDGMSSEARAAGAGGEFDGSVAWITGAGSGIGRATALAFTARGARVALVDRDAAGAEQTAGLLRGTGAGPDRALVLPCDVVDAAAVRAAVRATVQAWGRLDCAVNAAGVEGATRPLLDEDDDLYERTMDVNVRGVWHCLRAQVAQMLAQQPAGGAIVNLSSGAGLVGSARSAVYGASKHAVIGLTRSAALQYAKRGVRINAVCPSGVQTPMAERIVASFAGGPPSRGGAAYPLGRYSTPEEVASAILWLCSPGAASAIGSALVIDGGFTAT